MIPPTSAELREGVHMTWQLFCIEQGVPPQKQERFNNGQNDCNTKSKNEINRGQDIGYLLDNARFLKFMKKHGIYDHSSRSKPTKARLDLVFFAAIKRKKMRRLDFDTFFEECLPSIALSKFPKAAEMERLHAVYALLFSIPGSKQSQ